ncbi:MAG TPA: hypothetical protein PLQ36_02185 [Candidatus Gracilibacteria bacterium]|nr:hypothetical protein [Candidatus Gracilibacteria bacterium]
MFKSFKETQMLIFQITMMSIILQNLWDGENFFFGLRIIGLFSVIFLQFKRRKQIRLFLFQMAMLIMAIGKSLPSDYLIIFNLVALFFGFGFIILVVWPLIATFSVKSNRKSKTKFRAN